MDSNRYRVLVVDDNIDSAQSMSLLLELEGHEVTCAHDGHSALDAASAFDPEVVLLDLGLPEINGYEVARRLRAEPRHAGVLLIAISGYGRDQDRAASQEAGFDFHLTKPADPDMVMQLMQQHGPKRA